MNTTAELNQTVYLVQDLYSFNKITKFGLKARAGKRASYAIESTVIGVCKVYSDPTIQEKLGYFVWQTIYLNGEIHTDDGKNFNLPKEVINGLTHVDTYYILDEPMSHEGLCLAGRDIFFNINDAMKVMVPTKKKHLRRTLKSLRNGFIKWFAKMSPLTATKIMYNLGTLQKDKKVYVRKK